VRGLHVIGSRHPSLGLKYNRGCGCRGIGLIEEELDHEGFSVTSETEDLRLAINDLVMSLPPLRNVEKFPVSVNHLFHDLSTEFI
jgi:hypothetical protein